MESKEITLDDVLAFMQNAFMDEDYDTLGTIKEKLCEMEKILASPTIMRGDSDET